MNLFTANQPYRPLFILGFVLALVGVGVWPALMTVLPLPRLAQIHSNLMIGGFLVTYSTGFLMTAIPRISQTNPSTARELVLVTLVTLMVPLASWLGGAEFQALAFVHLALLSVFALRRFLKTKAVVPQYFVFLPVGLLCGLTGLLFLLYSAQSEAPPWMGEIGKTLYYRGMILSFIMGVGSFLIPGLLGHSLLPGDRKWLPQLPTGFRRFRVPILLAAVYVLALVLPVFFEWTRVLLPLTVSYFAFKIWKVQKLPPRKGVQPTALYVSIWLLISGTWLAALVPAYSVHFFHVVYIGSFSLVTFLVATRVLLAHGGFDLGKEVSSRRLLASAACIIAATLARAFAQLQSDYVLWLYVSATLWSVGALVWAGTFLGKAVPKLTVEHEAAEKC